MTAFEGAKVFGSINLGFANTFDSIEGVASAAYARLEADPEALCEHIEVHISNPGGES